MTQSLRVIINAQLPPGGVVGGIEQFVTGLVHSLGRLDDGPEEYLVVGRWDQPDWLGPYLGTNQRIVRGPQPPPVPYERVRRLLGPLRGTAGKFYRGVREVIMRGPQHNSGRVPTSNGFYEALNGEVVHFPFQSFVQCQLPTVFNPHDLQHRHFPEFFSTGEIVQREYGLGSGCRLAQAVAAESQWVKDDISRQYQVAAEKIIVVRRGAPTEIETPVSEEEIRRVREKFQLPENFAFYPAQTWPHKNHLRLLEAVRLLKQTQSFPINVICTGTKNDFWPTIAKYLHKQKLESQVNFLGYVSSTELRVLYRLAQFMVFPSLFEGGGFPVMEGFLDGVPVACSQTTSLPEYAGEAALFFDPNSAASIAQAMHRMSTDSRLRDDLRRRGTERIRQFCWERTAMTYRALYRKLARRSLSEEDRTLLAAP